MIARYSVTSLARLAFAGAAMVLAVACGGPKPKPAEPAAPAADAHVAAAVEAMASSWNGDIQFVNTFNALDPSHVPSATGGESAVPSLLIPMTNTGACRGTRAWITLPASVRAVTA